MKLNTLVIASILCSSHLLANTHLDDSSLLQQPQTEFEQLAVIMAKYGNNPEKAQAINYALLQQDEAAVNLLLKYGATLGEESLCFVGKSGNIKLFKKVISLGVDIYWDWEWTLMIRAIFDHHNEIAMYLLQDDKYMSSKSYKKDVILSYCSHSGNNEMFNAVASRNFF